MDAPDLAHPSPPITTMPFLLLMTMLTPLLILAGVLVEMGRCPNGVDAGGQCRD